MYAIIALISAVVAVSTLRTSHANAIIRLQEKLESHYKDTYKARLTMLNKSLTPRGN